MVCVWYVCVMCVWCVVLFCFFSVWLDVFAFFCRGWLGLVWFGLAWLFETEILCVVLAVLELTL